MSIVPLLMLLSCCCYNMDPITYWLFKDHFANGWPIIFVFFIRFILHAPFLIPTHYLCMFHISLCVFWSTLFKAVKMLKVQEIGSRYERVVNLYNRILLFYSIIRETLEPLITFGITAMWNCAILYFWLSISLFKMSVEISVLMAVLGACIIYGFICAMGLLAKANQLSKVCLENCFMRASQSRGFQEKVVMKMVKACRSLNIPCKPLGEIDRRFQIEFIKTLQERVMELLLITVLFPG